MVSTFLPDPSLRIRQLSSTASEDKQLAEQDRRFVELLQELGVLREDACRRLQDKCELSEEEAKEKIEKYWFGFFISKEIHICP